MIKKILGIITARGSSKGFPGKNICLLNGKPLIAYTINAALESKFINKTIVSSDDDEILKVSKEYGATILKRPKELALDTSSSEEAINHVLQTLSIQGENFDILVLLQPTSPLRGTKDIDNAIELMLKNKAAAVISVTNIGVKPFKSYYLNEKGFLQGVHNNKSPNMRRQDLPDAYLANGAIYAINVDYFFKTGSLLSPATIPYIMGGERSVDVDSIDDLNIVENLLKLI